MCVSSKLQCYISHRCDSTCTHVSNEHSFVKSIVESSPRILRSNDATVRLARCVSDGWLDRPKKSARPIREINACGGGFFFFVQPDRNSLESPKIEFPFASKAARRRVPRTHFAPILSAPRCGGASTGVSRRRATGTLHTSNLV